MTSYIPSLELVGPAGQGNIRAISRLISRAESGRPEARDALAAIYRNAGRAHVIGLTGVPGSGKSTLVAILTAKLREKGGKVAIVAIDPSSPYSGGSILGDRIRMSDLANDPNVYIRSMATRGAMGGLARATLDAVDILDHGGFETIIIETVGVGQDEVEIAKASHTTIVVSAPGLGDDIQAIKAGMMEIADIHVVSKSDRSDANRTLSDLKHMMTLGIASGRVSSWKTPVLGVSSYSGEGLDALVDAIVQHRDATFATPEGDARKEDIARFRLEQTAENLLVQRFRKASAAYLPPLAAQLRSRDGDPYALAERLLAQTIEKG